MPARHSDIPEVACCLQCGLHMVRVVTDNELCNDVMETLAIDISFQNMTDMDTTQDETVLLH